jgi:A/G-specific adenine glycosylase
VWTAWLQRWPTPQALAAAAPGDAVRMWGRLGYPRRALRLHECAREIEDRFGGRVPDDVQELESLPGVGAYTARAVAVFGYGRRHPVVDTNVRRVVARAVLGRSHPGPEAARRDHAVVAALLPDEAALAGRVSIGLMELGALVCTARAPRCGDCPVAARCRWALAGSPASDGPAPGRQAFRGTDRQVRGLLLEVVRQSVGPVARGDLDLVWHDVDQRERALAGLVTDGLLEPLPSGRFALPGKAPNG